MSLLNQKVIVLSGFARGGTSIVWNILQSHPQICSSIRETGQIFNESFKLRVGSHIGGFTYGQSLIDEELFRIKMQNVTHYENKYKSQNQLYTEREVKNAALCLKSVNFDIYLTELLWQVYPDLYFVSLIRNGYALCDGYIRRGKTAKEVGELYQQMADEFRRLSGMIKQFKMVRFEDVITDPFKVAQDLFLFSDVIPVNLKHIRLKSKKVIRKSGKHAALYGDHGHKYWFDPTTIHQILDPSVNQIQLSRMKPSMIADFNEHAADAMEYFGYNLLEPK
jgi:hypothetical protein